MKFYSAINQAVKMAEVDYGDKKYWAYEGEIVGEGPAKWFKQFILPYIKYTKTEMLDFNQENDNLVIYFSDGSALQQHQIGVYFFYPGNITKCLQHSKEDYLDTIGKCRFTFQYLENKGFVPYNALNSSIKTEDLKQYCYKNLLMAGNNGKNACTLLLMHNNWKIPDDYPYKVSY